MCLFTCLGWALSGLSPLCQSCCWEGAGCGVKSPVSSAVGSPSHQHRALVLIHMNQPDPCLSQLDLFWLPALKSAWVLHRQFCSAGCGCLRCYFLSFSVQIFIPVLWDFSCFHIWMSAIYLMNTLHSYQSLRELLFGSLFKIGQSPKCTGQVCQA